MILYRVFALFYEGELYLNVIAFRKGCTMPEIWDVEDPDNAGKEPLCITINRKSEPYFKKVYHNDKFQVFKILL